MEPVLRKGERYRCYRPLSVRVDVISPSSTIHHHRAVLPAGWGFEVYSDRGGLALCDPDRPEKLAPLLSAGPGPIPDMTFWNFVMWVPVHLIRQECVRESPGPLA